MLAAKSSRCNKEKSERKAEVRRFPAAASLYTGGHIIIYPDRFHFYCLQSLLFKGVCVKEGFKWCNHYRIKPPHCIYSIILERHSKIEKFKISINWANILTFTYMHREMKSSKGLCTKTKHSE